MKPDATRTSDDVLRDNRAVLDKRTDLAPFSTQEALGILAAEAKVEARKMQILLDGGVDTRERLEEYVATMLRRSERLLRDSEILRGG